MAKDDESVVADRWAAITVLHCCEECVIAFCGRSNGHVDTCHLDDPENTMRQLYKHRGTFMVHITCIDWAAKPRIAVSGDGSSCFRVMQITTGPRGEWGAELLLEQRVQVGQYIRQVLIHPEGTLVLVSCPNADYLWCVKTGELVACTEGRGRCYWKRFHRTVEHLVLFEDSAMGLFAWSDLGQLIPEDSLLAFSVLGDGTTETVVCTEAVSIVSGTDDLVFIQKTQPIQPPWQRTIPGAVTTKIFVIGLSHLEPPPLVSISPAGPSRGRAGSSPRNVADLTDVNYIIGTVRRFNSSFLVFLSNGGWVCSVELSGLVPADTFQRHFFIPSVWRTGETWDFNTMIRRNQDVIFVHNNAIIVVKNGLDRGEYVSFGIQES